MTTCFARFYIAIFFMLSCYTLDAQEFLVDANLITTSDGLSGITTYSIVQDNDHFVWVSTVNGLDRYDGGAFNFFSASDYQLKEKYIGRMVMDSNNLLWLLNIPQLLDRYTRYPIKNFSVFNTVNQKILPEEELKQIKEKFQQDSFYLPKTSGWPNRAFFSNQKGEIWTYQQKQFQLFKKDLPGAVQGLVNMDSTVYLSVEDQLIQLDLAGKIQRSIRLPGEILDIWIGEKETIWATTYKKGSNTELEIWKISPDDMLESLILKDKMGNFKKLSFEASLGDYIHRTKAGLWLVNLNYQVYLYSPEGVQIMHLNEEYPENYSFSYRGIVELENALLLSTSGGIIRLTIHPNRFKLIHAKPIFSNSRTITEGSNQSIIFNETFIEQVDSNYQNPKTIFSKSSGYSLYYQDSVIWFGNGYRDKVAIYEKNLYTGETINYDWPEAKVTYCIRPTNDPNLLWVGGTPGLALLDIQQKRLLRYTKINGFNDLEKSEIRYFHENKIGFWLATNYGVFLLDEKRGVLQQFNLASGDLPFDDIAHIHEDKDGVFWLATLGGGMIRWEPYLGETGLSVYEVYNMETGLSHDIVYGILEDENNRLWISSNNGLMLFNKKNESIISFFKKDGLPNSEFNLTSHYKTSDGKLLFGGIGGIIALDPMDFDSATFTNVPLVWTSLKVLEEDATEALDQTQFLLKNDFISFSSQQKFMEFEFKLLDFDNENTHQYAYKIEGFSDTWNYLSRNSFRIAHLPYGQYTLKVKGGNITQGWSREELILGIIVPRPFYLKDWFFVSLALCIVFASWGLIAIRTRQLQKDRTFLVQKVQERTAKIEADKLIIEQQAEQLKRIDQLKTNFFTNITHELRTPLSLIIGPASQLVNKHVPSSEHQDLAKTIYKNANNLLGLTDELLDLARIDGGTISLQKTSINLEIFLQNILDPYQEFAAYQQINYTSKFSFPKGLYLNLDIKKVEKIVHNLLSNAFKFTPTHGAVNVNSSWRAGQLKLEVRDTGRGIDPEVQPYIFDRYFQSNQELNQLGIGGTGIGLAICKEYLHLMDGTIWLESELDKGTTFLVAIPAHRVNSINTISVLANNEVYPISDPKNNQAKSGVSIAKNPYQILVAEDNIELANYLKKTLSKSYEVQLAHNGKEAWRLLQQTHFDLLVSDVMMPEMNGLELLAKVKADTKYKNLPFMMLTALKTNEERINALRIGVDDYLQKPFLMEEVELRIKLLLNRYSIRNANPLEHQVPLSANEAWLKKVEEKALDLASNPDFTVAQLAAILNISERSLFNKLRASVGVTPGAYIREIRLNQARQLLEQKQYQTVAEVCYAVGFQKPSYFTQLFKTRFGQLPSKYFK